MSVVVRHDHPLIHCSIARGLWSFVMRILGFNGSVKVVVYFIWRNLFGRQLVIDLYGHFGGGGIVAHFVNFGVQWIIHEKVCVFFLISKKIILKNHKKTKTTHRVQRGEQKRKKKRKEEKQEHKETNKD